MQKNINIKAELYPLMLFYENNVNGTSLPLMRLIKNTWWVLSIPHNAFCTITLMAYFTGMVFTRKPFVVYQTVIIVFCRITIMGFTPMN